VTRESAADDSAGRSVVRGVFAVLRELREETAPLGVSTLSRRVGLPKSTVQRLLVQMAAEGAVERVGRAWTIGLPMRQAGLDSRSVSGLRYVTRPRLRRIALATGASTFLAVGDAAGPVTLDQVSGALIDPRISPERQMSMAAHPASAAALAIAAGGPAIERGAVGPGYECIADLFPLATGDVGVLTLTLPRGRGIEQFVKALHHMSENIGIDVDNVGRDGGW
jgi:DNA-binding IclR family transcriptional regulator